MRLNTDIYQRVAAAKTFIDQNFESAIDLELVSSQAFISKFHFHRLFRQIYQRTPHQYITYKRMEKAKNLLVSNGQVAEVCRELGYDSVASFSLLFKREFGSTPAQFRSIGVNKKIEEKCKPSKFIPNCFIEGYRLNEN